MQLCVKALGMIFLVGKVGVVGCFLGDIEGAVQRIAGKVVDMCS